MGAETFLGVDIGTYKSKGVITDGSGKILSQASISHELSLPKPGWAEHDADQVWWHDFRWLVKKLLNQSGFEPAAISAIGCSGIDQTSYRWTKPDSPSVQVFFTG